MTPSSLGSPLTPMECLSPTRHTSNPCSVKNYFRSTETPAVLPDVPLPNGGEALLIDRSLECAFQLPMTISYMAELAGFFERIFPP